MIWLLAAILVSLILLGCIVAVLAFALSRSVGAIDRLEQDRDIQAAALGALTAEVQRHDDVLVELVKLVDPDPAVAP